MKKETKFKWGDRIQVIGGFYEGQYGNVRGQITFCGKCMNIGVDLDKVEGMVWIKPKKLGIIIKNK